MANSRIGLTIFSKEEFKQKISKCMTILLQAYPPKEKQYLWLAYTITLNPQEQHLLKTEKLDELLYFKSKLSLLEYGGLYVQELTKKGITHLHGITVISGWEKFLAKHKEIKSKSGKLLYYTDPDLECSNVIKRLKNLQAVNGWITYMLKCCPSATVLEWFQNAKHFEIESLNE